MRNQLTPSQEYGLESLLKGRENIFITGGPGTGKSFLVAEYLKRTQGKIPVVASTGAAAILVGGRTFHSFFGLGIMQGGVAATFKQALKKNRLKRRLQKTESLVIDEVSMLSADVLDCAEKIARACRQCDQPWGGIRVIAVGDFAQLPPITKSRDKEWCFLGEAWSRSAFKKVVLGEVKRTEDKDFLEVLEDVRWGRVSKKVEIFLNDRMLHHDEVEQDIPHLFPRRYQTEAFNKARLAEIPDQPRIYKTEYEGEGRYIERLMRDAPVPPALELKKGAFVMFRVNDPRQRYVNGTVGRIVDMDDYGLLIDAGGRSIELEPFTFTVLNDEGKDVASATNFPVNLAYASTIHKIQGATLERVHVDLKSLWEPGQAYVALSRARSGKAVTLMGWDENSIMADPCVRQFYEGV